MAYTGNGVTRVAGTSNWQPTADGAGTYDTTASNDAGVSGMHYSSAGPVGYIPAIWSGLLVEKWYNASVIAAITSTDYEGEIKSYGVA